jgi:hypothetical protein
VVVNGKASGLGGWGLLAEGGAHRGGVRGVSVETFLVRGGGRVSVTGL